MSNRRMTRLSGLMQSEISRLLSRQNGLEIYLLTVTHVEVTPDLRNAFVYISSLNKKVSPEKIISETQRHSAHWQKELASRLNIKYTPRLEFRFDTSLERGDRVVEILEQLDDENPDA